MSEKGKEIAINTNVKMYQNGEKIDRIHDKLVDINSDLKKAEKNAKEITSFWYYLKQKVKGAFGRGKDEEKVEEVQAKPEVEKYTKVETKAGKVIASHNTAEQNVEEEVMDNILDNLLQMKHHGKILGK